MPIAVFPAEFNVVLTRSVLNHLNLKLRKLKLRLIADQAAVTLAADQFLRIFREELLTSSVIQNLSKKGSKGPMTGIKSLAEAETHPLFGMIGFPSPPNVNEAIGNIRLGSTNVVFTTRKSKKTGLVGSLTFDFSVFSNDTQVKIKYKTRSVSWARILEYGISISSHLYGWWIDSNASRSNDGIMVKNRNHSGFAISPLYIFRSAFERAIFKTPESALRLLSIKFIG